MKTSILLFKVISMDIIFVLIISENIDTIKSEA